jgi:hypothetical protein
MAAPNPVLSTLHWFRAEYQAHVLERRCPAGTCTMSELPVHLLAEELLRRIAAGPPRGEAH